MSVSLKKKKKGFLLKKEEEINDENINDEQEAPQQEKSDLEEKEEEEEEKPEPKKKHKPVQQKIAEDQTPVDPNVPPQWFNNYVLNEEKKQNELRKKEEKLSKKKLKVQASEDAKEKWNDGLVRDRVEKEVGNHFNRMYFNVFGKRL